MHIDHTGPGNQDPNSNEQNTGNPSQPSAENAADQGERRAGARGTAAMDPGTRQEVARKGGIAVSRNKEHMAEIGRKGGQAVSRNREHMAKIGRKGGAASRGGIKEDEGGGTGSESSGTGT
jgi:general stress protein YciG